MFEVCPKCEIVVEKFHNPSFRAAAARTTSSDLPGQKSLNKEHLGLIVVGVAVVAFVFFGNVHFISGSTYDGRPIVSKISFGFSETFINTDKILGRPWISVQEQHPLAVKVLQREGWLESEAARERRIQRESRQETQREMDRIQRESERLIRDLFR